MAHILKQTEVEWGTKSHRCFNVDIKPRGEGLSASEQTPIQNRNHPVDGLIYTGGSLSAYIVGSGAAGTAPPIGDLLKAMGLSETIAAGSVTYVADGLIKTNATALTIDTYYGDGLKVPCTSSFADGTLIFEAVKRPVLNANVAGLYTAPTEASGAAALETAAEPRPCKGLACTLGGKTLILKSVTIALNNELDSPNSDMNSATGVSAPSLTDQNVTIEIVAVYPAIATDNYFTGFAANTKYAFSMVVGASAGNILTITGDVYLGAWPEITSEGGKAGIRLHGEFGHLAAETKLTLAFT